MNRRRKRRLPFAAYAALAFNAAICLTPFVAARAMSTAYGDKKPAFEATPEAITATIQAMDARFTKLSMEGDGAPREVWSSMVREELEANNMTSVRGLLLSAPAMLDDADGAALKARVAVADQSGEEGVLAAAVAYLPEDLQDEYERRSASPLAMFSNSASPAPADAAAQQEPPATDDEDAPARFSILGDLRDLALQAASWARQDRIDEFAFTLAGVGLILADPEAREGASIALSARRSQTLDPEFQAYLERKLFDAVPPAELKKVLEAEFQSDYGYGTTGPAVVESVFKSSVDRVALESALADYRILREIANNTSAQAAVTIISKVKDGSDLSRAQLVATAGGDRAVALARYDGDHLLDTARTTVTWTNALRLQVAGVLICLILLGFLALSVFVKSFTRSRPKKFSAVYLGEEPAH